MPPQRKVYKILNIRKIWPPSLAKTKSDYKICIFLFHHKKTFIVVQKHLVFRRAYQHRKSLQELNQVEKIEVPFSNTNNVDLSLSTTQQALTSTTAISTVEGMLAPSCVTSNVMLSTGKKLLLQSRGYQFKPIGFTSLSASTSSITIAASS